MKIIYLYNKYKLIKFTNKINLKVKNNKSVSAFFIFLFKKNWTSKLYKNFFIKNKFFFIIFYMLWGFTLKLNNYNNNKFLIINYIYNYYLSHQFNL